MNKIAARAQKVAEQINQMPRPASDTYLKLLIQADNFRRRLTGKTFSEFDWDKRKVQEAASDPVDGGKLSQLVRQYTPRPGMHPTKERLRRGLRSTAARAGLNHAQGRPVDTPIGRGPDKVNPLTRIKERITHGSPVYTKKNIPGSGI